MRMSKGEGELPYDLPVNIDVTRVMGTVDHPAAGRAEGLLGHIIDIECFTKHRSVQIKLAVDPNSMAVLVDGEEVYRWIQNRDDLPTGRAIFTAQREADERWVDALDLQGGDVVTHADDGIIKVQRAKPVKKQQPTATPKPRVEEDIEWE